MPDFVYGVENFCTVHGGKALYGEHIFWAHRIEGGDTEGDGL